MIWSASHARKGIDRGWYPPAATAGDFTRHANPLNLSAVFQRHFNRSRISAALEPAIAAQGIAASTTSFPPHKYPHHITQAKVDPLSGLFHTEKDASV